MNFLSRLFRRRVNPTLNWGADQPPIPDFDVSDMKFGRLKFGDSYDAAEFLGRPDRFEWITRETCNLLYASRGFEIEFYEGRFESLAFFIGPDENLPKHPELQFSTPRLCGRTPDGIRLSQDIQRASLEHLFGRPASVDVDEYETILVYHMRNIMMEFEMNGETGRLKRWNLNV